jgi:hypothetical protein
MVLSVCDSEIRLGAGVALVGSLSIPLHCLGIILRHALARSVSVPEIALGPLSPQRKVLERPRRDVFTIEQR